METIFVMIAAVAFLGLGFVVGQIVGERAERRRGHSERAAGREYLDAVRAAALAYRRTGAYEVELHIRPSAGPGHYRADMGPTTLDLTPAIVEWRPCPVCKAKVHEPCDPGRHA